MADSGGVTLQALQEEIREWAIEKGWRNLDDPPRDPLQLLMLIVTEIGECAEAFRNGNPPCERLGMKHLSHAEEELADAVIRIIQMADEYGFNLPGAITRKMSFNWTRPYRHGGKTA